MTYAISFIMKHNRLNPILASLLFLNFQFAASAYGMTEYDLRNECHFFDKESVFNLPIDIIAGIEDSNSDLSETIAKEAHSAIITGDTCTQVLNGLIDLDLKYLRYSFEYNNENTKATLRHLRNHKF